MSSFRPVAVYGLTVPAGDMPIPAFDIDEYPATFRITMAAIDPSAKPEGSDALPRATLKMIRFPVIEDESDDDEDDEDYDMANLLDSAASDEEDDDEEEEDEEKALTNGNGEKLSKKAKKALAIKKLKEALASEEGMEVDEDEEDLEDLDDEDLDEDEEALPEDVEEFVICTLDPTKQYQQTLDITINENEQVLFKVSGNYPVYLTGNIVVDENEEDDSDDEEYDGEESFDMSPDEDELDLPDEEDESDDLDDLADPRVMEVDSDEEAAPKLVKADAKKGKNKRAAEDSAENTPVKAAETTAAAATEGDSKLSKSQQKKLAKKLKNNSGNAVDVPAEAAAAAKEEPSSAKSDKKVQFSKTLIQGPTGSASPKPDAKKDTATKSAADKPKGALGVKTVQGVTIDDKKLGSGPAAKKGDKVSMRYIGKLEKDKKVFDSNKKGPPFAFKLGAGQVIRGWDIGIAGMSVGGERRLTIPAHLAYGSKGQSGIPANSTLVFDVKCLEIK